MNEFRYKSLKNEDYLISLKYPLYVDDGNLYLKLHCKAADIQESEAYYHIKDISIPKHNIAGLQMIPAGYIADKTIYAI